MISPLYPIISSWYPHIWGFPQPPASACVDVVVVVVVVVVVSGAASSSHFSWRMFSLGFPHEKWPKLGSEVKVPKWLRRQALGWFHMLQLCLFTFFLSFLNLLGINWLEESIMASQKPPGWRVSHPLLLLLEDGLQGARHVEVLQEPLGTARDTLGSGNKYHCYGGNKHMASNIYIHM